VSPSQRPNRSMIGPLCMRHVRPAKKKIRCPPPPAFLVDERWSRPATARHSTRPYSSCWPSSTNKGARRVLWLGARDLLGCAPDIAHILKSRSRAGSPRRFGARPSITDVRSAPRTSPFTSAPAAPLAPRRPRFAARCVAESPRFRPPPPRVRPSAGATRARRRPRQPAAFGVRARTAASISPPPPPPTAPRSVNARAQQLEHRRRPPARFRPRSLRRRAVAWFLPPLELGQ